MIKFTVDNPTGANRKITAYRGGGFGNTAAYTATKEAAYYAALEAWQAAGCPRFETPVAFGYHYRRRGAADIDAPVKPLMDGAFAAIGLNDTHAHDLLGHKSYGHAETNCVCVIGDFADVLEWWLEERSHD